MQQARLFLSSQNSALSFSTVILLYIEKQNKNFVILLLNITKLLLWNYQ